MSMLKSDFKVLSATCFSRLAIFSSLAYTLCSGVFAVQERY